MEKDFQHLQGSSNFLLGFQPLVLGSVGDVHQPNSRDVYTPIIRIPYQEDNHPQYKEFLGSLQAAWKSQRTGGNLLEGHLWDVFTAFLPLDTLGTHRESLPLEVHDAWISTGKGHVFLK